MRVPCEGILRNAAGVENGSSGSKAVSAAKSSRRSSAVRAIAPAVPVSPPGYPREGKWPLPEMRPGVGFKPAMPQKWAGTRIDPPPSLATPPGEQRAAMAAASPPLEPPGVRSESSGWFVRPVR